MKWSTMGHAMPMPLLTWVQVLIYIRPPPQGSYHRRSDRRLYSTMSTNPLFVSFDNDLDARSPSPSPVPLLYMTLGRIECEVHN